MRNVQLREFVRTREGERARDFNKKVSVWPAETTLSKERVCGEMLVAWDRILCLLLFIKTATAQELPIPNLVDGSVYLPDLV